MESLIKSKSEIRGWLPGLALVAMLSGCAPTTGAFPVVENTDIARQITESSAPYILDVRSVEEYEDGHIPGAVNIPYDELEKRLAELSTGKNDEIVVYCRSGRRAVIAEEILAAAGYTRVKDLAGHMNSWTAAGLATEK